MKYSLIPLILLAFLLSACAQKHYCRRNGDEVAFYYKAADAKEVLFASSQNHYQFLAAKETKNNMWEISVPGEQGFSYFYIVDGVVTLPDCPFTENDDFGSKNCLYMADM